MSATAHTHGDGSWGHGPSSYVLLLLAFPLANVVFANPLAAPNWAFWLCGTIDSLAVFAAIPLAVGWFVARRQRTAG